jgi:PAS domain S-box-containing protein
MSGKKSVHGADDLRKKEEEKISHLSSPEELPIEEVRRLVHELRVHQIELEMQNDALREAQAELLESNSRYTDLYDFAPVGYLTLDERCTILEANLTLARQLGIERSILIGHPFPNFVAPGEKDGFRSHVARIFQDRWQQAFETRLITRRKGEELYALLESMFVEDARGNRQCRISVTDISDRWRAEETVRVYMNRLKQSNLELQDFAFIASHDLQEPLRKVQTFGTLITEKYAEALDEEGRDFLDRMMKAAKRMSDMVHGLL